MEKEFIPYEQALELKELGFNERCFGMYCEGVFYRLYPNMGNDIPDDVYREVDCPTFSQAFRWFRENYKLTGLIEIGTHEYSFIIFDENTDNRKITSSINGNYEEAELACLKKLIELVKSK